MKNFLGFLSLEIGVNLLVAINLTISLNSFLINFNSLNSTFLLPWTFCILSSCYTSITWIIVYYGTYKVDIFESIVLIRSALNLWTTYTVIWFILAICAIVDNLKRFVCICRRCPESFWIFGTNWHMCLSNYNQLYLKPFVGDFMSYDVPQTVRMETVTTSNKDFERAILCIILVLINLTIGILTLSSYLKELKDNDEICSSEISSESEIGMPTKNKSKTVSKQTIVIKAQNASNNAC